MHALFCVLLDTYSEAQSEQNSRFGSLMDYLFAKNYLALCISQKSLKIKCIPDNYIFVLKLTFMISLQIDTWLTFSWLNFLLLVKYD